MFYLIRFLRYFLYTISAFSCIVQGQSTSVVPDVFSDTRAPYQFPWAGGMNSCQFGKLDINLDGIKDLVVFDRAGDRIMPFLVIQSGDNYDYQFAPEYADRFPALAQWVIFADYNLDGKEDIFTYSPGYAGLKVYRNVSESEVEFSLEVFPFLTSFQGGGYVNILVTYADLPAIVDLDGDGDLDILTFWGLGSFVEKHTNMSMEKYGHADSLDFVKTEYCWGYFAESEESNNLTLDTCLRCSGMAAKEQVSREAGKRGSGELGTVNRDIRHTGSSFLVLDLNGDELPDLLLGDVDYPNLVALFNGGNVDTARMVAYDWQFPADDKVVNLFSMPAAFYDDYDFDGINDLLVSPFDPNPFLISNFQSVWLYNNEGNNNQPQFHLQSSSFLQDRMIDLGAGAYPTLYDIDSDGLTDMMVGNYGYYDTSYLDEHLILHTEQTGKVAYFKNTGTQNVPAFNFVERNFANISDLELIGIVPSFGDIDGDGDVDMLVGCETGQIISYVNSAGIGETVELELDQLDYQGIDVGAYSAPQLFDLDKDNLADLIIGEKGGNLNYYRNTGTLQKPVFTLITDSLGGINVTDPAVSLDGYSIPFFYRDGNDYTHLLVGSEQGMIYYFTGIDNNLTGKFNQSDTLASLIGLEELKDDRGYRSAPALFDLNDNGYPDLICGNFSGGLEYLGNGVESPVSGIVNPILNQNEKLSIYPVPAHDHINIACTDCRNVHSTEIYLYDSKGSLIYSLSGGFHDQLRIDVASYPRGVCLLMIILKDKDGKTNTSSSSRVTLM